MKTILLSFIVTVFLFANGHSKDLSGTKLKCTLVTMEKYLEFVSHNEVIEYDFMPSQIKYWIWNNFYKVNVSNYIDDVISLSKDDRLVHLNMSKMKFNKSEIEKIYKKNDLASHLNDEYHTKLFMKNILSNFINE